MTAASLFSVYVLSRLAHFYVVLTGRSHELRATCWTFGSVVIYLMTGAILWKALQ